VLSKVAGQVGDPQVRHRGTIGGSIAHGDPASDLPAVVLALGGTLVVRGPAGERTVPASEFHLGFLETALAPEEMLVEIRVPKMPGATFSFQKFNRRAQDWAIVGVVAVRSPDGTSPEVAVSLVNMGSTPLRASSVETAVRGGEPAAQAASRADEGTQPPSDLGASSDFRRHLARVLVRRSLEEVGV
jgi:carbon-monoxide dehydrogenase medium subunit